MIDLGAERQLDAIAVLGRGINQNGLLSDTGFHRAEVAVVLATILQPQVVVMTGGRSWEQTFYGIETPTEGGAMLTHAEEFIEDNELGNFLDGTKFVAAENSISTVENLVDARPLLGEMGPGKKLGLVSDSLHFKYDRPQRLGQLVFPEVDIAPYPIPERYTLAEDNKEMLTTIMTSLFMIGAKPGNDESIMRHQRRLERVTSAVWRRKPHFLPAGDFSPSDI